MKVLVYIDKSDVRGGIEIFAERQVARLRAEGHDVDVSSTPAQICICGNDGNCEQLGFVNNYDEIIVHKCARVATLEMFPPEKTVCYIHDHEPTCPRTYAYTPLGRNCARPGGIWPCAFCAPLCRGWKGAIVRVLTQRRRLRALSKFKKLVVISQFMKSRLVANGLPAEKIVVEPPNLDVLNAESQRSRESNSSTISASLRLCVEKIDLLYVGQLIRGKGVHLLLTAMARMRTPRTLDIVGTGNMEAKLRAQAARLGLDDRVRFHGFQPNPQEWMLRAACVVVPSFWQEPYGLVAAEAVALGCKVVAFAVGGLPEACGGKATLVPPGNITALAAALEEASPSSKESLQ